MNRLVLLGGTGFLGKNLIEFLDPHFEVTLTSRNKEEADLNNIYFDFLDESSWENLFSLKPDIILNSAGYGVVKDQQDINLIYQINYLLPARLVELYKVLNPDFFWAQIGSGFEYDLSEASLHENSRCIPRTHYGISKYMMSHFLIHSDTTINYIIFRPFAMYGSFESSSKIIPYLILAQKNKTSIPLSDGLQKRDYIFVSDAARFMVSIIKEKNLYNREIINIGTGESLSIKNIAEQIASMVPNFEPALWKWGQLPQRANESFEFYNASLKAFNLGLTLSPRLLSLKKTIEYYYQN